MTALVAAALAGVGVHLLVTARRPPSRPWRAGLGRLAGPLPDGTAVTEVVAATAAVAVVGGAATYLVFGRAVPALIGGALVATAPVASVRARRRRQVEAAHDAWPRLLEELRLLTGSVGRSIPQALVEVGRRAPEPLRPAFAAAEREWLLTTDFERMVAVLQDRLADPTADAVAETLVVANEVGGGGLDARLAELVEDRLLDAQGRQDAAAKQAGVRFARRFVLVVPIGMALAGLSIGSGRAAYATTSGQLAVAFGLLAIAACWWWSGRLLRLPAEPRVFARRADPTPVAADASDDAPALARPA